MAGEYAQASSVQPPSMGAVGSSASASKSEAMGTEKEVFERSVTFKETEDKGFIISASYRKERKASSRDPYPSTYCPPKEYVATSFEEAVAQLRELFGVGAPSAGGAPPA